MIWIRLLLLLMPLLLGAVVITDAGGGGGGNAWTDSFNRSDDGNISTGAPTPPGTYTEVEPHASCPVQIDTNQLQFAASHNSLCDNNTWQAVGDTGVGSVDMCVLWEYRGHNSWVTDRGIREILRAESTSTPGMHYENRCSTPDCQASRWERIDGTSFQEGITAETDCDDEIATLSVGHYRGSCVTGTTNTATRFRTWHFTSAPSDTEDASTWGTADCDTTPSGGYTADDSGELGGLGVVSRNVSSGDTIDADNLSVTDLIP